MLDELDEWQDGLLKKLYTFFCNCMYVTIHKEYEIKNYAVYTILDMILTDIRIHWVYDLMNTKISTHRCKYLMS